MTRHHTPHHSTFIRLDCTLQLHFLREMVLQSIKFNSEDASLEIIDQLLLPEKTQYLKIKGVEDGWSVINKMQVRDLFVFSCKHIVALRLSSNVVVDKLLITKLIYFRFAVRLLSQSLGVSHLRSRSGRKSFRIRKLYCVKLRES